jgi:hypothetical protein
MVKATAQTEALIHICLASYSHEVNLRKGRLV